MNSQLKRPISRKIRKFSPMRTLVSKQRTFIQKRPVLPLLKRKALILPHKQI
jgi:hypothetical protein